MQAGAKQGKAQHHRHGAKSEGEHGQRAVEEMAGGRRARRSGIDEAAGQEAVQQAEQEHGGERALPEEFAEARFEPANGGDGGKILIHAYAPVSLTNYDLSHVGTALDGAIQPFSMVFINRHSDLSQVFPVFISDNPILSLSDTTNKVVISDLNVIVPHTASDGGVAVIQCTTSDDMFLTQLYLRENSILISDLHAGPVCKNSFFDVFFSLDVVGGTNTGRVTFFLNGSDFGTSDYTTGSDRSFSLLAPSVPGDYPLTLHAKDHLGINVFDTKTTTVTVKGISVNISVFPSDHICKLQTATLTASGAPSYLWSTAETSSSIVVSSTNVYTVIGFSDSCSDAASISIVVNPLANLSIVAFPSVTLLSGQTGELTAFGATSYLWSTGETTASIFVSDAGIYTVTGLLNDCSDSANITITVLPAALQQPSQTNFLLEKMVLFFLILYSLAIFTLLFFAEESF